LILESLRYSIVPMKLVSYLTQLASHGRYYFSVEEARTALEVSQVAVWAALQRLEKKGEIASPLRGFYVIVPPEYRSLGCLPPEQFIPNLMQSLNLPYYVGLLSAAHYYGAAHQQPQTFQVMVQKNRSIIESGRVRVRFFAKQNIEQTPTRTFNTPKGVIQVSTPEATAIDLVEYSHQSGGLSHVATVLTELAEQIIAEKLIALVRTGNTALPTFQRLGYLLTQIGETKLADTLYETIHSLPLRVIPLSPRIPIKGVPRDSLWKVAVNLEIESDL